MNETILTILNRRSIRQYTNQSIEKETIELLLQSAMYAPSARNEQPWHFLVVQNRMMLDELTRVHPYASMLKTAPLAILVCADKSINEMTGYLAIDCSAATQNILLSAHSLGIGSVWLGVYPREERMQSISDLFELPENIIPISLIAIGYPAEFKDNPDRFQLSRINWEKWKK